MLVIHPDTSSRSVRSAPNNTSITFVSVRQLSFLLLSLGPQEILVDS
jgi:hypothetical protein